MSPEPVTLTGEAAAELLARIATLEAENTAIKAASAAKISFKVAPKGGMSLYGLQRWPITLYSEQWIALLDKAADIRAFLASHKAELKVKANGNG